MRRSILPTGEWRPAALRRLWRVLPDRLGDILSSSRVRVMGHSMTPLLWEGDVLLVSRAAYMRGKPAPGDVVLYRHPHEEREDIKRVLGLPGDAVEVRQGRALLHGVPLDEPYLGAVDPRAAFRDGAWSLGRDEYFLIGDNRGDSLDSRAFGPVRRERIVGLVWYRYAPAERAGVLARARAGQI
jgi:signal peptidase I